MKLIPTKIYSYPPNHSHPKLQLEFYLIEKYISCLNRFKGNDEG